MTLIKKLAIMSLDYIKTLSENKQEEYAKAFYKFNNLYQNKKIKHIKILLTFVDPIKPKDIMSKKG